MSVIVDVCEENINFKCFFQGLTGNLDFQSIWNWILQILHHFSQDLTKLFPIVKYKVRRRKNIKSLHKRETIATGKIFLRNQISSKNTFLHTSIKISENFDIKNLQWSKADLSKETKKLPRKDTLRVSEVAIRISSIEKAPFKNFSPVYLLIIEIDIR